MLIVRTPFRISFFGGGTDYPVWYRKNGGAVLGTTIDKYCYITCRYLPPFFEHKHRIVYSLSELVRDVDEIRHPSVRETLRYMGITDGVEIHHDGDLPARTGLGSSSAFTVGLIHALYALKGTMPTKMQLAREAIYIEQELIKENVGSQDQTLAAFGGLKHIYFNGADDVQGESVVMKPGRLELMQDHLMLFFTGFSRTASQIAEEQIKATPKKEKELNEMHRMVDTAVELLNSDEDICRFGELLHESWLLKRSLSNKISTPYIDYLYEAAMGAGATGGKILGAGGGGFILFFVRPELQHKVIDGLPGLLHVPFRFENAGSQIIFYEPNTQYAQVKTEEVLWQK